MGVRGRGALDLGLFGSTASDVLSQGELPGTHREDSLNPEGYYRPGWFGAESEGASPFREDNSTDSTSHGFTRIDADDRCRRAA
ncbi:hypothetical protein BH23ACI1_BH23ACI1_25480 [soil metagenome]